MRTLARLATTCLCLGLGACAVANTPLQNLAYERWQQCGPVGAALQRVDADGRVTFISSNGSAQEEAFRCLSAPAPDGSRLPRPIANIPAGGA